MITHISPREAELIRQIDEQGGHLVAWRDRAIAAEQASKWESDLCGQALEDRNASETKHAILVDEFEAVRKERDELREGIKRHEEMAGMATAEIAVLTDALAEQRLQYVALFGQFESATAELARLRAVEPVALPGSRTQSVYLAGPMTGYADFNFPAFNAAANGLRAEGLRVVNPADHGLVEGATWADYLRHDIAKIAGCESIALLPGWSKSKGAQLEVHIARALEMPIRMLEGAEAAPPAQPAEQQAQTVCKRTLIEIDARLRECSIVGASAADAYDTFYQHMVETALAAQPAEPIEARSRYETAYAGRQLPHTQTTTSEPVQRLSDAGIEALAGKHGTTYRNRHFPTQPAFSFSNGSLHRFVRDIESAIQPQPGWRDVESAPKEPPCA